MRWIMWEAVQRLEECDLKVMHTSLTHNFIILTFDFLFIYFIIFLLLLLIFFFIILTFDYF